MPTVDLLVIGGGIHGACVARDAALRGLSVVLVEKDDLASGTSSRSSKLIHGGLRYLDTGQFGLVREALHERAILLRTARGLVRPLRFMLPFYRGDSRPPWMLRAGLTLYDLLAGRGQQRHTVHSRDEVLHYVPALPPEGLTGGAWYEDAQVDDALLVVANAVAASFAGALIRTHVTVTGLTKGPPWRAQLSDGDTVEARLVVNAAGPWVDVVRASAFAAPAPTLRLTRGTHVVLPAITGTFALLLFARRDGRVFFVLPWHGASLVGTTDTDDGALPDQVTPAVEDVHYLWDEIARRWPSADPAHATRRVFAGVRPLARTGTGRPWDNSREAHVLVEEGMISMIGGKYTTARLLAEKTVDTAVRHLGVAAAPCATRHLELPGTFDAALAARADDSAWPDPTRADVERAVDEQFARRVSDVIFRRSMLWLDAGRARFCAPRIAEWMSARLGWSEAARHAEVDAVLSSLDQEARLLAQARESFR